jgi:hypothetical protein
MFKKSAIVAAWAFGSAVLTYAGANLSAVEAIGWGPFITAAINVGAFAAWSKLQETWTPAPPPAEGQ